MTAHELARVLLEMPDVPVQVFTEDEDCNMDWMIVERVYSVGNIIRVDCE